MAISQINSNSLATGVPSSANMPAGSVIQVVNATRAGNTVNTTSGTATSFGATASITPKFTTSKILVIASGGWFLYNGNTTEYSLGITRNGTSIPTGGNDGLMNIYGAGFLGGCYAITILDAPATTSSTTYLVTTQNINGGTSSLQNGIRATQLNEITLLEIAA